MAQDYGARPQPGWFDLLNLMISGMIDNAGEAESQAFLHNIGEQLAGRYPLPAARTVQDLETQINLVLARFNWGFADLQPQEGAMLIQHLGLPGSDDTQEQAQFQAALSAVLCGLYGRWLREQGGSATVPVVCESTAQDSTLTFRYQ